jgi:Uncharacterized conserved protein (DUF2358)
MSRIRTTANLTLFRPLRLNSSALQLGICAQQGAFVYSSPYLNEHSTELQIIPTHMLILPSKSMSSPRMDASKRPHQIITQTEPNLNSTGPEPDKNSLTPQRMNRVIDVLRHDLPRFFHRDSKLQDDIYHPYMTFKISNPPHLITSSKHQYLVLVGLIKWSIKMSFTDPQLHILNIVQTIDGDREKIEVRWLMDGDPLIKGLHDEYEGVFIYFIRNEMVVEHWIETIHPMPTFFPDWCKIGVA